MSETINLPPINEESLQTLLGLLMTMRSNDAIPDSDSSEDYDREIDFSEPLQGNFVPFQPTISNSVAPPLPAYSSTPPPLPMVTDRQSGSFSPALPPSYQQHQIERPASGSYNPGLPPALPSYSTPPPLPSVTDRPQSGSYSNSSIPPPLPQLTYLPPPPTDQSHPTFQTNSILPPPPNFSTSSNIPAGFQTPPLPQYNRPPSGPQTPPTLPGQDYHSNRPPSGPIPPPLPQHDSRPSSGAYAPPLPLYNNSRPLSGSHGDPPPPPSIYSQAPVTPNQAPAIPVTSYWQPDSSTNHCPLCKKEFTILFRKHHCRDCGRGALVIQGKRQRVCNKCVKRAVDAATV